MIVEIGGLTLHGATQEERSGWYVHNLTDWYSVPDAKSSIRERSNADGAFGIAVDWRKSATPSIDGFFVGETESDVLIAQRALKRALGSRFPLTLTVTDALGPTSRTVSVRSVKVNDHHGRPALSFSVDMVAPDPNRYGPETVSTTGLPTSGTGILFPIVFPADFGTPGDPGRVLTVNDGAEDTFSLLAVTGGLGGGFELLEIESGRLLRFERPIPEDSTVFLNPRTGRAWIDELGNDVTAFLTRREWWSVPAGGSRSIQFTAIGGVTGMPTLTARTAPAF